MRLSCEDDAPNALNEWLAGGFPAGIAGGFLRFAGGGGAARLCGFEPIVEEEEEDNTEPGESGGSIGERGEDGRAMRSVMTIDACAAGADVGVSSFRSRVVSVENAAVVASASIEPARWRNFCVFAVVTAVTMRGRLVVLSALGWRRLSKWPWPWPPRDVFWSDGRRGKPMSSRFSALRLAALFLPRMEFERSCRDDASASTLGGIDTAEAEVADSAGLVTRLGMSVLRNCTHHSPERQRWTRRFVVGSMSQMGSFSMRDSSVCTIWARLYGIERSWVFVSSGCSTRKYVCRNCGVLADKIASRK